jgi:hypothetical protein
MGEAYKTGLFAMTPLRICMNSSMKQPLPIRGQPEPLSNEGPASLADLYTLTLGIREHRVTFAKDVSKFHQCMEADKVAQHVRRILWRFGGTHREMNVFLTTRVNYRDRQAGCMAIAVVLETVERFSEGKKQAPSFCRKKSE